METQSRWYNEIEKQINNTIARLDRKEAGKYKVDLLLCLAERVDSFDDACSQCQTSKQEITELSKTLSEFSELISMHAQIPREERKKYYRTINSIIRHLQKGHNLITEGQNLGMWMAIGTAIGVAIGISLDSAGAGIPLGIGIGMAIGALLDWKAKKEGRVICPRSAAPSPQNRQLKLVIVGLVILVFLGFIMFFYFARSSSS